MSEFGIKKSLNQITGALEGIIETIKRIRSESCKRVNSSYPCSMMDVIPRVPMCFYSGLMIVNSVLLTIGLSANLSNSSSTDFPVSKTEDRRLLANTSGDTSMNIWFVARRRRMRAGNINRGQHIKPF